MVDFTAGLCLQPQKPLETEVVECLTVSLSVALMSTPFTNMSPPTVILNGLNVLIAV